MKRLKYVVWPARFPVLLILMCWLVLPGRAQNQAARPVQTFPNLILKDGKIQPSSPQDRRDQQLVRIARTYMNMNQYQKAIGILKELRQRHPEEPTYYRMLLNAYLTLSRVSAADSLVRDMLKRHPGESQYRIDQAMVLYRQEKKEQAQAIWKSVLDNHPRDSGIYNRVANAMLQNRLIDQAIAVYQLALKRIPDADYFYQNIANLYQGRLMYAKAARYYLKYLEKEPRQQKFIFHRILSFRLQPEERPAFFRALQEMAQKSALSEQIYLLMAQLHQRYREFDEAYHIYRKLDSRKGKGDYLLQFADAARQDSSYQIALKAYREFIEQHPDSRKLMEAYSGAVTGLYQLARRSGDTRFARQALDLIDAASRKFAGRPGVRQLSYLKGVIFLNYFFDVDRAANVFRNLSRQAVHNPNLQAKAQVKLGECYLIKGQLTDALKMFRLVHDPRQRGAAQLRMAQTHYFRQDWEQAQKVLKRIVQTEGLQADVTNDALALQMKIALLQQHPELLTRLSEADLLIFQRKKSEAARRLGALLNESGLPPGIKSELYQTLARLKLDLKEVPEAIEVCRRAVRDSSQVRYGDRHLFLLGTILEKKAEKPREAFKIYEEILRSYPNSLFADQARERLNRLKKNYRIEIP